jgi:hypothetical protein
VRAGRGKRDYLGGDTLSLEHPLAVDDVPVPRNRDVVIARVMKTRVAFSINRNPDYAVAAAKCVEILRRIKMVVYVDQIRQLARR